MPEGGELRSPMPEGGELRSPMPEGGESCTIIISNAAWRHRLLNPVYYN
jgi:hypothetical protein